MMRSEETHRRNPSFLTVIIAAAVLVIAVFLVWRFFSAANENKKDNAQIITQSRLEKIINVRELSTFETIYNGIARVSNKENPELIDYYVYYESRVKTGIDFSQVDIAVDPDTKKISVAMPEIIITDINVDIASLDYIFENKKANTPTVSQEAYKACQADVKSKCANEDEIYELAEQNAKKIISALVSPFVEQLDAEYELEFN